LVICGRVTVLYWLSVVGGIKHEVEKCDTLKAYQSSQGITMFELLKFQVGNAKLLLNNIRTFSLPSGHSCPSADECMSKADRITGTIVDGIDMLFRCFSTTDEARSTNARNARWWNFDLLRQCQSLDEMVTLIKLSLPCSYGVIRIHVSGDYFNQMYFDAWCIVARDTPNIHFYSYTKSLNYWVNSLDKIPSNLNLTASVGGRQDQLIKKHNLKYAQVVFHPSEADKLGLRIDHDDSLAMYGSESFALLLHGTQPAKSVASKAKSRMQREGIKFSYSKKDKAVAR
jgi:hypothetical protein